MSRIPNDDGSEVASQLERWLRLGAQALGAVFVVVGGYSLIDFGMRVASFARTPAELEPTVVAAAELIDAKQLKLSGVAGEVDIGRPVAVLFVVLLHLVAVLVLAQIVSAGGRLLLGVVNERREFLAAMREFMRSARDQQAAGDASQKRP